MEDPRSPAPVFSEKALFSDPPHLSRRLCSRSCQKSPPLQGLNLPTGRTSAYLRPTDLAQALFGSGMTSTHDPWVLAHVVGGCELQQFGMPGEQPGA